MFISLVISLYINKWLVTIQQGRANRKQPETSLSEPGTKFTRRVPADTVRRYNLLMFFIQTRNTSFFLITYYHTLSIGHGKTFFLSYYISFNNFLKTKFLFTWFRVALFRPENLSSYILTNCCSNPQKCWKNSIAEKESFQSD